jgi:hypothetical protein
LFGGLEINVNDGDAESFDGRANAFSEITLQDNQIRLERGNLLRAGVLSRVALAS